MKNKKDKKKVEELRAALIKGEKSGFTDDFDAIAFLEKLHQKHGVYAKIKHT